MKLTKRSAITAAVIASVAAAAAVAVPSGNAQAPGATTLTFYEPDAQSLFKIIDNPPKTFGSRPGPRSRFSVGDHFTFIAPLYDKKGGTRQGKIYATGSVVKGGSFDKAAINATANYVLTDGSQIAVQGYITFNGDSTIAIVGGTGRYEGARGHLVSSTDNSSSTDTLTILP